MVDSVEEQEGVARVKEIRELWDRTGLIDSQDMSWLLLHTESYFHLGRISDDSWAHNRTEIFAKELEIEDLKRQLEKAQYGE